MRRSLLHWFLVLCCIPSLVCATPLCSPSGKPIEQSSHCQQLDQAPGHVSDELEGDCCDIYPTIPASQQADTQQKYDAGQGAVHYPGHTGISPGHSLRIRGSPVRCIPCVNTALYLSTQRIRI